MKKIIGIFLVLLLISFISYNNRVSKTVKYNGNNILVSVDGESSDKLPSSGNYYLTDYKCGSKNTIVSWDSKNYKLSISNGNKNGGVACSLNFKSNFLLSEVEIGSYVKYSGTNGCNNKACDGVNPNYVSDDYMGYCSTSDNRYINSGWRVAYVKDNSAYLISAGSVECVTRSASATNVILYVNDLNTRALKYCNVNYVYDGKCINSNVHAMNEDDYQLILGKTINNCINSRSNMSCGYNNDLIDNGGYYFLSSIYDGGTNSIITWNAKDRDISYAEYSNNYGLRPVIRINSSVLVKSGDGTYNNPPYSI